jgi:LemA protein
MVWIMGWFFVSAMVLILFLTGWALLLFNSLVRHRNLVREGWSLIEVQLKKRHDLVPRLLETVKAYAGHEQSVLVNAAQQRSGGYGNTVEENSLSQVLRGVLGLAEAYPDLKADQNFRTFQQQLVEIEDQLGMARRYYNGTVRNYNIHVQSFPSNLVALAMGFRMADYFEIETATERQVPRVTKM